jgi:hypothetical protein
MTLLSGVSGMLHESVAITAPMVPVISLSGTVRGLYSANRESSGSATTVSLFASGRLNPLGSTFTSGNLHTPGSLMGVTGNGTLHVRARHGTLTLQLTEVMPSAGSPSSPQQLHFTYNVTQATGNFQGDQGTGTVDVSLRPFFSFFGHGSLSQGRVSLNFHATPTA